MKDTLVFNVDKDSYKIISNNTMTVGQLKTILDSFDDDMPICFGSSKMGYQKWFIYGRFNESDIRFITDKDFEDEE